MKYGSTRGRIRNLSFEDVLFSGFLSDGGMALPQTLPQVSRQTLLSWVGLSYRDLVLKIVPLFVSEEELPASALADLVDKGLSTFDTPEIAPIISLAGGLNVFELFHGRTWAFKDLGMCILGQLFNYFLEKRRQHLMVLVATSGDTGSAAIEAVRGLKWVDIIVALPRDRCSKIQELMMTTVKADNVFVYRADGTSDDIDKPVKRLFADLEFSRKYNLCSANSLNWARLMVQVVHFYYAYLKLCPDCDKELEVVIPTGACGNVTSGVVAKRMGLPVKFVCCVNSNDIVARTIDTGVCQLADVVPSLAPAMDMQFAYNFERLWYLLSGEDYHLVDRLMREVETEGKTTIPPQLLEKMQAEMKTFVLDDEGIKRTLRRCWDQNRYLLCPHTATAAAYHYSHLDNGREASFPSVCLATASPLKFSEALSEVGLKAEQSERVRELLEAPTHHLDLELTQDWEAVLRSRIELMTQRFHQRMQAG